MLCDFAYMTSSEMCMAVTLDTSCLAVSECGHPWGHILVSEWLYASLFLYNAWAMAISVSV